MLSSEVVASVKPGVLGRDAMSVGGEVGKLAGLLGLRIDLLVCSGAGGGGVNL